jgi:hypothetical protein
MIYLHTKVYMPISNGSLPIPVKLKTILTLYIQITLNVAHFLINYHTSFQDSKVSGASVTPPQVRTSTILLLPTVGN